MIDMFIFIGFLFAWGVDKNNIMDQCNDYIHEDILNNEVRGCLRDYGYVFEKDGFIDINLNREPAPSKNMTWGGFTIVGLTEDQKKALMKKQEQRKNIDSDKIQIEADKVAELKHKKKEIKKVQGFKKKERWLKFSFFDRWKLDKHPERSFVITMKFTNGTCKTWVIKSKEPYFKYAGKMYSIVYEENYFDLSLRQFHLFYAENHPIPINREIVQLENPSDPNKKEAYFSVTPSNLEPLIKQQYVKALTGGEEFQKTTKALLIIAFINLIATIIILILMYAGGQK